MSSMICRYTIYATCLQAPPVVQSVRGAGQLVITSSIFVIAKSHRFQNMLHTPIDVHRCLFTERLKPIEHIHRPHFGNTAYDARNVIIPLALKPCRIFDDFAGEGSGWLFWCFIAHTMLRSPRFHEMLQKLIDFLTMMVQRPPQIAPESDNCKFGYPKPETMLNLKRLKKIFFHLVILNGVQKKDKEYGVQKNLEELIEHGLVYHDDCFSQVLVQGVSYLIIILWTAGMTIIQTFWP